MPTGLLEMTGSIDVDQFWPKGTSDADTTKILITIENDAFRFRPSPAESFRVTHAFENAEVVGKVRKAPIDSKGRVTVRLQGVDAPELHYRPSALVKKSDQTQQQRELYLKWNLEYRQRYGETATIALFDFLAQAQQNPLPCKTMSAVDSPNDLFDTYARLVGDIMVEIDGAPINLNHWLLENGWTVPTFYSSMTEDEITTLTNLAQSAKSNNLGLWPDFTRKIIVFDWDLEFRGKGADPEPSQDAGPVIVPKLFRRQATYQVNKRSKMVTGSFAKYLQQHRDDLHLVSDYLEQGPFAAEVRYLDEFVVDDQLKVNPEGLVFREKPSRVRRISGGDVDW